MAILGEASIIVRAIGNKVGSDLRRGFSGADKIGANAGSSMGKSFSKAFNRDTDANMFGRLTNGLRAISPEGVHAIKTLKSLERLNYTLGTAIAVVIGGLSALVGGLLSLGSAAVGAASSVVVLGNVFAGAALAMIAAKLALGGVGKALSALNKPGTGDGGAAAAAAKVAAAARVEDAERSLARVIEDNRDALINANNDVRDSQLALNKAIIAGQEEIQQLGFDAENAALSESRAALELDKARETLARTQDLPPNSRARKEAELAYQEADFNLRKARDASADLNKEQDRLAKTGVSGTNAVISASRSLADAEDAKASAIVDSIRKQADAERELAKAKADALKAGASSGGGADPLAGLNKFQIDFVRFLQTLKPKLDELKLAVSEAFLPPLQTAITTMVDGLFPTIKTGMTQVAAALGAAAIGFANIATESRNVAALGKMFANSATLIEKFGGVLGNLYAVVLELLNGAFEQAKRFVDFLNTRLKTFDEYLKANPDKVENYFKLAGDAAADFGEILGNIFGGIGGMVMANLGPGTGGQYLLDWLKESTQGFQDMGSTVEGKASLKEYFNNVAVNAQKVLSSLGALISELGKLGEMKEIGQAFDILGEGAPKLGLILKGAVEAGPALAKLVVAITDIGVAFSGEGNPAIAFFDTLRVAAQGVADVLNSEIGQKVINTLAPIFGVVSALTLMGTGIAFFIKALVGAFTLMAASAAKVGVALTFLGKNPIILIVAALAAAFIYLYSTSEEFATSINQVGAQMATAFGDMATSVMPAILSLMPIVAELVTVLAESLAPVLITLAQLVGDTVVQLGPILGTVLSGLVGMFGQLLTAIIPLIPVLMDGLVSALTIIMQVLGQVFDAITPLIPVLMQAFQGILDAVLPLIPVLIDALVPAFLAILQAILPLIPVLINTLIPIIMQLIGAFMPLVPVIQDLLVTALDILLPMIVWLAEMLANIIPPIMDIVSAIITFLVPVFMFLVDAAIDTVTQIVTGYTGFFQFMADAIGGFVTFWTEAFNNIFGLVAFIFESIVNTVVGSWNSITSFIQPALDDFFALWGAIFGGIGTTVSDVWKNIYGFFTNGWNGVVNWITGAINNFVGFFKGAFQGISDFIGNIFRGLVGVIKGPINAVISLVNGMIGAINSIRIDIPAPARFLFGGASKLGFSIPRIPQLALGGVVAPTPGGTLAQIAEAGKAERVEPLDGNGMSKRDKYMVDLINSKASNGNINITVNPSAGMDERALANMVSTQLAFEMRKGGTY
jgi:phage-related protein